MLVRIWFLLSFVFSAIMVYQDREILLDALSSFRCGDEFSQSLFLLTFLGLSVSVSWKDGFEFLFLFFEEGFVFSFGICFMNQNNLVTHPFPKLATLLFMHSVSFLNWVTCLFFFFSWINRYYKTWVSLTYYVNSCTAFTLC